MSTSVVALATTPLGFLLTTAFCFDETLTLTFFASLTSMLVSLLATNLAGGAHSLFLVIVFRVHEPLRA
jgi:hypothetical protein